MPGVSNTCRDSVRYCFGVLKGYATMCQFDIGVTQLIEY